MYSHFPISKLTHKATVIKTVWYWHTDQWHRIESPEINPYHLGSTDFQQGCQDHPIGNSLFNKWYWDKYMQKNAATHHI